jgi:hypothetical protein
LSDETKEQRCRCCGKIEQEVQKRRKKKARRRIDEKKEDIEGRRNIRKE